MTTPQFDDQYLDRSANKWAREQGNDLEFVVWHETASPNPDNPHGTLSYNLAQRVQSSYNYLIARDGTIFHYINERSWIAYHAGLHSAARGYVEWGVNAHSLGVEVDGRNNGEPITTHQRDAIIALMVYFNNEYKIPLLRSHHLGHHEVAPGYKSDPRGFSVGIALAMAQERVKVTVPQPPQAITDPLVIGVTPSITLQQFIGALVDHKAPLSIPEVEFVYGMAKRLDVDPAFLLAVWKHEGGSPLGSSELQKLSHNPLNIKAPMADWRQTVFYNGTRWFWYESFQLGLMAGLIHLKNHYGARGLQTVRAIIEQFAPISDGNTPDRYVLSVLQDMAYMRSRS